MRKTEEKKIDDRLKPLPILDKQGYLAQNIDLAFGSLEFFLKDDKKTKERMKTFYQNF
jgi:hypothetical protein